MMVRNNKALVRRFIREVWGQGNLDLVDELVATDHVHHLSRRDVRGPDGVMELVKWFRAFLPDLTIDIHNIIGEGNTVVAYFTFHGTDKGGYGGRPASQKQVAYQGIDIFRLDRGRIVERWGIVDTASLLQQIGDAA